MAGNLFEELPKAPTRQVKTFTCKKCAASVPIRAASQSVSAVCASCGTIFDVTDENFNIISTAASRMTIEPLIPLGQRGKLRGSEWEMIGFMQRYDKGSNFSWSEYLLFNPYKGFRWLAHNNGHWNYITMLKEKPTLQGTNIFSSDSSGVAKHMGVSYKVYYRGQASVAYVSGEFYWRVKVEDTVTMEDYIHPPEMLSCERNESEETWSLAEYVEPEEVRQAFKIEGPLPPKIGVAPNQPSSYANSIWTVTIWWVIFSCIILTIQVFHVLFSANAVEYEHSFTYIKDKPNQVFVSQPFELTHGTTNVDIGLSAPVDNNWFAVEGELINDKTGESYNFDQTVEYYYGTDSDGSWTEGGTTAHRLLSSIPEGTYHLDLELSGPVDNKPAPVASYPYRAEDNESALKRQIEVKLTRQVPNWSNFLWALLLVFIYPLIFWLRSHGFEVQRWSDSEFSPYGSSEDEE